MGNGRKSGKSSRSNAAFRGLLVAVFTLPVAASVLLGLSFRHTQKAASSRLASPLQASSHSASADHAARQAQSVLGQLPLMFEPNRGQAASPVKFLARGSGYTLFLDTTGATLGMQTRSGDSNSGDSNKASERFVRMKMLGANPAATTTGTGLLPGKSNYFIGNDKSKWHSGIPQFSRVQYKSVYPGIDLVFYGKQGQLEYDFQVAPGADPTQAELQFEGATKLDLQGGDLILTGAEEGGLRLQAPQIYQRDGDRRQPVAGRFILRGHDRVGFEIGSYDRSRELVIDPILVFASYFGGNGSQTSPSVAVNGDGNIFLVGSTTTSAGFPVPGTLLTGSVLPNIFVAQITPSASPVVVYLTFLGGSGSDTSVGLAIDGGGDAYIVGNTSSTDFPSAGFPYQTTTKAKTQCTLSPTCTSVFVSELNPSGTALIYSTYLSGTGSDQATGMAIDTNRDVFVTGTTSSTTPADVASQTNQFPVTYLPTPFQTTALSPTVFFVTKVNTAAPGASGIAYSTYFGGGPVSGGTVVTGGGVAVDAPGNIYFSGTTNFFNSGLGQYGNSTQSSDFPIVNSYQPCLDTPILTNTQNAVNCVEPTATPYPTDAFVAEINPNNAQTGNYQLLFSTYLGGSANDSSTGVAVDPTAANVYLTGSTNSPDFLLPTLAGVFQPCLDQPPQTPPLTTCTAPAAPAPTDAYVARITIPVLSTTGTQNNATLGYFSYLGGTGNDSGAAIAVDGSGDAFITGSTSSGTIGTADPNGFPVTTGAIQSVLNGPQNAFFARLNTNTGTGQSTLGSYSTYYGGTGTDSGTSVALDPVTFSTFYFAGDTTSPTGSLILPNALQSSLNGTQNAFVAQLTPVAAVSVTPTVLTTGSPGIGNQVTISYTVTNNGPDLATGVYVNGTVSSTNVTFFSATAGGGSCTTPVNNSVVCTIPTLQVGTPSTINFVVTPNQLGSFSATAQVAKVNNTNTNVIANASFTAGSFTMSASPASVTVAAGQTAPYSVLLSPIGAFGNNISLACSGAPSGATCNFSSTSVAFSQGTGSASAALNITTTPQPVSIAGLGARRGPLYALALLLPGMAFFGVGVGGKRRRARWLGLLALSVVFMMVALQPACSSNKQQPQVSGTPSGTYFVTVTATSGTFSQSKTIQLTVTP
jgi:hypothetical protein